MKHRLATLFLIASFIVGVLTESQGQDAVPTSPAKPLEFAIPVSAAFDLLGVNPSTVMKPGMIRDFKVDWSFQSWRLKPNIAIQAQPVWELLYNRNDLLKYQGASKFMKVLSTLDLSFGTIEDDLQNRRLAGAAKVTLFREEDPLDVPELYRQVTEEFYQQQQGTRELIVALQDTLKQLGNDPLYLLERFQFQTQLTDATRQLMQVEADQKQRIANIAALYVREHWNASFVDVAVGRSYTYKNETLDSLGLHEDGIGAWINGSIGLGRKIMLSGLIRYASLQTRKEFGISNGKSYLTGLNLRYGSPKFNFFAEVLNQSSEGFLHTNRITLAYGGDWRFSRNVMLSYGLRTVYTRNFQFKNLVPIASISCMMR